MIFRKNWSNFFLIVHEGKNICLRIHLHELLEYSLRTSELDEHFMNYGYFHTASIGIFIFLSSNNLTYRFFGYITAIILYIFLMSTETDGLLSEVKQKPEGIDDLTLIDLGRVPEAAKVQMWKANQVIIILSLSAEEIEVYEFRAYYPIILPGRYHFTLPLCTIDFKPGWGICRVKLGKFDFDIKTPETRVEFLKQLKAMSDFLKKHSAVLDDNERTIKFNTFKKEMMSPTSSQDSR